MSKYFYVTRNLNRMRFTPVVLTGCLLIACGGGSGGSSDDNINDPTPVIPTTGTMTTSDTNISITNNTDSTGSSSSADTSDLIGDSGGSPVAPSSAGISCDGSRVWGPVVQPNGDEIYVSEGFAQADDCTAIWVYKPNVNNCSEVFFLGDTQSVAVSDSGTLLFSEDGAPSFLEPANISLSDLDQAPDCPSEDTSGMSISSTNNTDNTGSSDSADTSDLIGDSGGSTVGSSSAGISCDGSRVWGPIVQPNGDEIYVSEGFTQADNCTAIWVYKPNVNNCSGVFFLGDTQSVAVSDSGTLLFSEDGAPTFLEPANISLSDLDQAPDCPSEDTNGTSAVDNDGSSSDNNNTFDSGSSAGITPLSCNGNRVWGPFVDQEGLDSYMSEPNGRSEADWPECGVLWYFDPAQACRITNIFASGVTLGVDSGGNGVITTSSGSQLILNTAGLTFDDLANIPSCP